MTWSEIVKHPLETDGTFDAYVQHVQGIEEAFAPTDGVIRCIDEACPGGVHSAGSLILMPEEQALAIATKSNGLTSHANCGAAAKYAARHNVPVEEADGFAAARIQEIARKAGVPYIGHIGEDEMISIRPVDQHVAFVVYYDGTGRFDWSKVPGLPVGFTVSRRIQGERAKWAQEDLAIAIRIALSEDGWGAEQFRRANRQLIVVAIGSKKLALAELKKEAREVVDHLIDKADRSLIRIDGFDASQYENASSIVLPAFQETEDVA